MDSENEIAKAKWLLAGVFLFLVSGCFTYRELNFWLRGADGQATVLQVFESRGRRGSSSMTVEYEFTDVENNRRGLRFVVDRCFLFVCSSSRTGLATRGVRIGFRQAESHSRGSG